MNMNIIYANKMYRKIFAFVFCTPLIVLAQNKSQNYVKEIVHLDSAGTIINLQYFNGIGDLIETATTNSGSNTSLFTYITYDTKGRERKLYNAAPLNGESTGFLKKSEFEQASHNYYNDYFAYTENHYDTNNRIIKEDIGGQLWHNNKKSNTISYGTNTEEDKVIRYGNPKHIPATTITQYYPTGSLEKETTKDADGNQLIIFKDLDGNVILERKAQGDTYYIYSNLGQLTYVLSPKFQESPDLDAYAYQYEYDKRGNLTKRVLPGAKYIQYWYDKEGRMVLKQDAQLREKKLHRFYLYDTFGRLAVSGVSPRCKTNVEQTEFKTTYSANSTGFLNTGYLFNSDCISAVGATVEKIYYYDTYEFLNGSHREDFKDIAPTVKENSNGLLAGSVVWASNGEYIYTVNCYDTKGNLTNCLVKNINGYISKTTFSYSITNNLKSSSVEVDVKYGDKLRISEKNGYSSRNDKLTVKTITMSHGLGDYSTTIQYQYDSFNKLLNITRPQQAGVVVYQYDDIHGWPTSISTNSFTEYLSYADGLGKPCYNGNISSIKWKNKSYNKERGYRYSYDNQNRLIQASYGEGNNLTDAANHYDELVTYDLNSNITSLKRHGKKQDGSYGLVDDLRISLAGNQILEVTDAAEKIIYQGSLDFNNSLSEKSIYMYNDFGALTCDVSRDISMIEYDNFTNPTRIQFSNGNVTKYIYSAEGAKLRTIHYTAMPNMDVSEGTTYELSDAEVQEVDSIDYLLAGNLMLKNGRVYKYLFNGGYCDAHKSTKRIQKPRLPITLDDSPISEKAMENYRQMVKIWQAATAAIRSKDSFRFYYFNEDHLGNVREVIDEDGNIKQENNYYPYGNPFFDETTAINAGIQPFKYNKKEFDTMHGLNTYDYGARQYNPIVPTWDRMDPLCESFYGISPYSYCGGNPVNMIDPDGREPILGLVGTSGTFRTLLNNSPRGVGHYTGQQAANYLRSLGSTEWSWSQMRPLPTQTGYFNNREGRYIYTEKGGWLDMSHFMFYAGKAYDYKMQKQTAQEIVKSSGFAFMPPEAQMHWLIQASMNPAGESLQDGYRQEMSDKVAAPHSAYSYEDLPSDRFGADFGANYFDQNSKLSFGVQLENYLRGLGATNPQNAPNYNNLPTTYPTDKPTRTNKTHNPVYTQENP